LKVKIFKNNFFYLFILILTVANTLVSIVAAKYIAIDLKFSKTLIIWLIVMLVSYAAKFLFWMILHRKFKLSFIYPILSINYFVALFLGKTLFGEPITVFKIAGSVILVAGVFLILLSSQKTEAVV
jgi:drug/metabolite transporter (DMT)-like permease